MAASESKPNAIGHITLDVKPTGERRTGNPCAPFEVAGAGDGPRGTAPALDPTVDLLLEDPPVAVEWLADERGERRTASSRHNRNHSFSLAHPSGSGGSLQVELDLRPGARDVDRDFAVPLCDARLEGDIRAPVSEVGDDEGIDASRVTSSESERPSPSSPGKSECAVTLRSRRRRRKSVFS